MGGSILAIRNTGSQSRAGDSLFPEAKRPDFRGLLSRPLVALPLPKDFSVEEESAHLDKLWSEQADFRTYQFEGFIHAGGSGMVFRVLSLRNSTIWALKIARGKEFKKEGSPFSANETSALSRLAHPNIVKLDSLLKTGRGVIALATTYIDEPKPFDEFLESILKQSPKGVHPFSPQRLENACGFVIARCTEIASALAHMHSQRLYHCDIKPANILIGKDRKAILTDLGSCVHTNDEMIQKKEPVRTTFTWTYAHPDLQHLGSDPKISGGGLRWSADVLPASLAMYDLFAFGRTIQEVLAALDNEFGERCYSTYSFRYLHLMACLLLGGKNAPGDDRGVSERDNRKFVADVAMDYPVQLFRDYAL